MKMQKNKSRKYQDKEKIYKKISYDKGCLFQKTYLSRNPCECGMADIECLQFHHIKQIPNSIVKRVPGISTIKSKIKEMQKCIVLCGNCHRKLHNGKITTKKKPPTKKELYDLLDELFPDFKYK